MSIIRVRKDARYFTASNEPFVDKRLSWETRGLMGYLLTKPDNWEVNIRDLESQGPAKLHKLRRMLSEARLYGYMNRIRVTNPDGTFDWITEVFESPSQNTRKSSVRFSTTGRLTSDRLSTSGKPTDIINTESSYDDDKRTELLATLYQDNITLITSIMADKLRDAAMEFTDASWYQPAFEIAVTNNIRTWRYVETVLRNWKEKGRDWKPEYRRKGQKQHSPSPPSNLTDEQLAHSRKEAERIMTK